MHTDQRRANRVVRGVRRGTCYHQEPHSAWARRRRCRCRCPCAASAAFQARVRCALAPRASHHEPHPPTTPPRYHSPYPTTHHLPPPYHSPYHSPSRRGCASRSVATADRPQSGRISRGGRHLYSRHCSTESTPSTCAKSFDWRVWETVRARGGLPRAAVRADWCMRDGESWAASGGAATVLSDCDNTT